MYSCLLKPAIISKPASVNSLAPFCNVHLRCGGSIAICEPDMRATLRLVVEPSWSAQDARTLLTNEEGLEVLTWSTDRTLYLTGALVVQIGLLVVAAGPSAKAIYELVKMARKDRSESKTRCALIVDGIEYDVESMDAYALLELLKEQEE